MGTMVEFGAARMPPPTLPPAPPLILGAGWGSSVHRLSRGSCAVAVAAAAADAELYSWALGGPM